MYDDLAAYYHLIYEDWSASIVRQAEALDGLIGDRTRLVADVACGIGTQSLGLAARGYRVIASDLAVRAVERLRREARERGLEIETRTDDMTRLATYSDASVDVLIACDNSVPHLLHDDLIRQAFIRFRRVLKPGGTCILSVRDYAAMPRVPVHFNPQGIRLVEGEKVVVFQVWELDGDQYDLTQYFVFENETKRFHSRYYAVTIDRLLELLSEAGFVDARRLDGVLFQPVLVATA